MTKELDDDAWIKELDDATKVIVLQLIAEHDGKCGWYQLDRALAARGFVGLHWPSIMDNLRREDLVAGLGEAQQASTRYTITERGRRYLEASQTRSS
jgi:hypothetical protein